MSFPAFSGLFAILIAAAAAPPDDIPTCNTCSHRYLRRSKKNKPEGIQQQTFSIKILRMDRVAKNCWGKKKT